MHFKFTVMYTLLVLVYSAAATKISATNRTKRMLDGKECNIKENPSVVSITNASYSNDTDTGYTYKYGTGVLITMKWVLTNKDVFEKDDYTGYKVLAGSSHELPGATDEVRHIVKLVESPYGETHTKTNYHFIWRWRTMYASEYTTDVTLAELDEPFKKNNNIQPSKLPAYVNFVDSCKHVTAVLWGQKENYDKMSKKLTVVKDEDKLGDLLSCAEANLIRKSCYHGPNELCLHVDGKIRFCENDMGSGIFCNDTLVGILTKIPYGDCSTNTTNAYNISRYMNWLHKTTGIIIPPDFYDVIDTNKPKKRRTTKSSKTGSTHSTTEEGYETSIGHRMKAFLPIYALLICLRLILL